LVVRLRQVRHGLEMLISGLRRHAMLYMAVSGVCDEWVCTPFVTPRLLFNVCMGFVRFLAYAVVTPCVFGVTAYAVFFWVLRRSE